VTPSDVIPAQVSLQSIRSARERIAAHVRVTPVMQSATINERCGAQVWFKCENLQQIGAFKIRGATNAIFALPPPALAAGVVTHSSGNHGAAVAQAARLRGVPARVVMPETASAAKFANVSSQGGLIVRCAPTLSAREAAAAQIVAATGAAFIHPYDDPLVIAGQGTIALELLEQVPELDCVLCPVGGGGLASGIAVAIKALRPQIRVIAVEPAGADDAWRSFRAGALQPPTATASVATIADGLRGSLSARTFGLIREHVDAVVTVSEAAIVRAMRELWQHLRLVIEPSSAVPYAAIADPTLALQGRRVSVVLTGGNVDLDALPW
jgi:threonine dehydratase